MVVLVINSQKPQNGTKRPQNTVFLAGLTLCNLINLTAV